jgi:hypothetical protein
MAECAELANSSDSVTPVFRTALVINWPEKAMESRYKRFRELFPQITTLSHLKHALDSSSALSFCKRYLDINANKSAAKKNPKYSLLRELTNGFLDYQEKNNLPTEMAAIRKWCVDVDLKQLTKDFIGKRRGIGPGVVANLRLCLGDGDIVKPDRHVIGVMEKFLALRIPRDGRSHSEFARRLGMKPRYFDCILFKYGQARSISA